MGINEGFKIKMRDIEDEIAAVATLLRNDKIQGYKVNIKE